MTKINELGITEDGTYLLSEVNGKPYTVVTSSGYMVGVKKLYGTDEAPSGLFGRWTDSHPNSFTFVPAGHVYWDEVELVNDRAEALALAEMYGELAIWDNANNQEIRVNV